MSTAQETRLTADDLLAMPEASRFELVNGELVERKMSEGSSWVGGRIFRLLGSQIEDRSLGWVFPNDNGFQCFPFDRQQVRRPDAAVVLKARKPEAPSQSGFTRVCPNLVVEVVSPHDTAYEVAEKVDNWLSAGVDEVWVVMPPSRTVTVHTQDAPPRTLVEQDEIIAGNGAPGFRCRVADFFPPPTDATE